VVGIFPAGPGRNLSTARGHLVVQVQSLADLWQSPAMSGDPVPGSPPAVIDKIIEQLGGWRGALLSELRDLIIEAEPQVAEEVKWQKASNPLGVPVWSRDGIICTGEAYKDKVKLTFFKGAALEDPAGLFNASLEGKARRAIDFEEGARIDEAAFKALVRAAAKENAA
jgi:hypothetical protein